VDRKDEMTTFLKTVHGTLINSRDIRKIAQRKCLARKLLSLVNRL
jgi:hypothetical protein